VRAYKIEGANGVCLSQLPASLAPSAVQVQVFAYPTTPEAGDIEMLPYGVLFGSTATMVYLGNNVVTTVSATTLVNQANKQIGVQVRGGGAHLVVDVVGYFRAPQGGYVSGITAGTGLTGGTITTSGTIAADTTYLQRRVSGTCAAGNSIRAIAADGTVTCQADGPANAFVQNGNAFGATAILGTTDNNALDVRVNSTRVMRYEPHPISPNVIGGHPQNSVSANVRGATIAGGGVSTGDPEPTLQVEAPNQVFDSYGTIGGGYANRAGLSNADVLDAPFATVGGGRQNFASGYSATIAGGSSSTASGFGSFVGGGNANSASGTYSAIAGGQGNQVAEYYAFVGAGNGNQATGLSSSVLAGNDNIASGLFSVAWGLQSEARGDYSVAIGRRAKTFVSANNAIGAFVWADSNDFDFAQSTDNRFAVRATGGAYFVTAINASGGATESFYVAPTGDVVSTGEISAVAFNPTSDRNAKQNFAPVDNDAVLAAVASLPLASWSYRSDPHATRHIGPTAQDFRAAFDVGRDDKSIATVDADGVALAAIQGLNAKLEARIAERDARIERQASEIAELRRAVEVLMTRTSPQGRVALH
jgi:hypothetical protein